MPLTESRQTNPCRSPLLLFAFLAILIVQRDNGLETLHAQTSVLIQAETALEEAVAEPASGQKVEVEVLGYEQIDEVVSILKMLEEKTRANHDKLNTWSGRGELVRESDQRSANTDDNVQVPPLRRRAAFKFVIDLKQDSLYSAWIDVIPVSEVDRETGVELPLTDQLISVESVLSPEHWIRAAKTSPVQSGPGEEEIEDARQHARRMMPKESQGKTDDVVDLRTPYTYGGRLIGNPKPIWQYLSRLQTWPELIEKETDELKKERLTQFIQIERAVIDGKKQITVSTRYGTSPNALILSAKFDERVNFNLVQLTRKIGLREDSAREDFEYESREGVDVPTRLTYRKKNSNGFTREEITISQFEINEPISDARFALEKLNLNEGDLVFDEIDNKTLIKKNGKLIESEQDFSKSERETTISSTLARQPIRTRQWNSLLHQHVELYNHRLKVARGEIEVADEKKFLAEQRLKEHSLARELVRLAAEPGTNEHTAFSALELVITNEYSGPVAQQAAQMLVQQFRESDRFPFLCGQLGFSTPPSPAAETVLRGAIEKASDEKILAQACLNLGRFLRIRTQSLRVMQALPERHARLSLEYGHDYVAKLAEVPADALEHEAEQLLNRVLDEFRHLEKGTFGDRRPADLARLELIRLENSISRPAREIVGKDSNGDEFRLSDHDGKVRVLYFWGHWCGPCRKGYPVYRKLVEKYRDQPFAFLGINSDAQIATLQKLLADGEVTWDCWHDGAIKPWRIHSEWGLHGAPWIYVLDKQGRIRFYDVRGAELERAVEQLMNEPVE